MTTPIPAVTEERTPLDALNGIETRYEELYSHVWSDYDQSMDKHLIGIVRAALSSPAGQDIQRLEKETGLTVEDALRKLALQKRHGWQDIGTAPRDGIWCLYWDARYGDVKIARRGKGDMPQEGDWEYELHATHWMPLPEGPKT